MLQHLTDGWITYMIMFINLLFWNKTILHVQFTQIHLSLHVQETLVILCTY